MCVPLAEVIRATEKIKCPKGVAENVHRYPSDRV